MATRPLSTRMSSRIDFEGWSKEGLVNIQFVNSADLKVYNFIVTKIFEDMHEPFVNPSSPTITELYTASVRHALQNATLSDLNLCETYDNVSYVIGEAIALFIEERFDETARGYHKWIFRVVHAIRNISSTDTQAKMPSSIAKSDALAHNVCVGAFIGSYSQLAFRVNTNVTFSSNNSSLPKIIYSTICGVEVVVDKNVAPCAVKSHNNFLFLPCRQFLENLDPVVAVDSFAQPQNATDCSSRTSSTSKTVKMLDWMFASSVQALQASQQRELESLTESTIDKRAQLYQCLQECARQCKNVSIRELYAAKSIVHIPRSTPPSTPRTSVESTASVSSTSTASNSEIGRFSDTK